MGHQALPKRLGTYVDLSYQQYDLEKIVAAFGDGHDVEVLEEHFAVRASMHLQTELAGLLARSSAD